MDLNIRVAGEAGQGIKSIGVMLVEAFLHQGLHVFSSQSYMSRIRGGLNWFDIRIADRELFGPREDVDLLVALTAVGLEVLRETVVPRGRILFNGPPTEGVTAIDLAKTARESGGAIMANSVAAGAVFRMLGYEPDRLHEGLRRQFAAKGEQVVGANIRCAIKGAELVGTTSGHLAAPPLGQVAGEVVSGATAIGLAAAVSGVKFVAAYPMTPSTPVFTYLAQVADQYGILVEQAEDEIAAANMICGATYAGAPALATTSGGGFALMVEAVSLAGMLELPVVFMVGQRPGPATGMPTRTAQQDLLFVLHAGHGEFPRAIFAPGTHQQAYELTRRALQAAHRYQTPAFLLIDQFLADAEKSIPKLDATYRPIDRCIVNADRDYRRYEPTESGVSPRAIPGGDAFVVVDSDEHTADGHISESLQARVEQQNKRMAKLAGLKAEALAPELYGPPVAPTLLLCWGSTYGPAREAVDLLNDEGHLAALLHFAQVWPINEAAARERIGQRRRVIAVEANHTAQLATLLRSIGLIGPVEHLLRYDGMPFSGPRIARQVRGD
jgi:2-oxoglutarate ferredoxin oxidoreductase subunit alpha